MMIGADKGAPAWYALGGGNLLPLHRYVSNGFLELMKTINTLLRCVIASSGKSMKIEERLLIFLISLSNVDTIP